MGDDWCAEFIFDGDVVTDDNAGIGGGGWDAEELKLKLCNSDTAGGGGGGGRLSLNKFDVVN